MSDCGWIKIHRSIWDNPWMYKPYVYLIWSYILCHVNYQPAEVIFEGKRITLKSGQGLFKLREMAVLFKIPLTSLHRIINLLKNETQIETQTSPRNTIITVLNWEKYQTVGTQNGTQVEHKRNTSGTQTEHLPIIKELKKNKKDKKIYGEYQNVKLTDEELAKLKAEFPDWKERIERLSEYIDSRGDKYKNHLSTIRSWARRDKQNGTNMDRQSAGKEPGVEVYERVIREAEERRKAGLVGAVPVGSRPAEQGVRTYPWQRKSTV